LLLWPAHGSQAVSWCLRHSPLCSFLLPLRTPRPSPQFTEALYIAEQKARSAVEARSKMQRELLAREKVGRMDLADCCCYCCCWLAAACCCAWQVVAR